MLVSWLVIGRGRVALCVGVVVGVIAALLVSVAAASGAGAVTPPPVNPLRVFGLSQGPPSIWPSRCDGGGCPPVSGAAAMSGDGSTIITSLGNQVFLVAPVAGQQATSTEILAPPVGSGSQIGSTGGETAVNRTGTHVVAQLGSQQQTGGCETSTDSHQTPVCGTPASTLFYYERTPGGALGGGTMVNLSSLQWPSWVTVSGSLRPTGIDTNGGTNFNAPSHPTLTDLATTPSQPTVAYQTAATDLAGYSGSYPTGTNVFMKNMATSGVQRISGTLGGYDPQLNEQMTANNVLNGTNMNGAVWTQRDASGNESVWVTPISDSGVTGTAVQVSLNTAGQPASITSGTVNSGHASISQDGRFVTFISNATNLGGTGGVAVYLRDRKLNTTTMVAAGTPITTAVKGWSDTTGLHVTVTVSGNTVSTGVGYALASYVLNGDPAVMGPNSLTNYQAMDAGAVPSMDDTGTIVSFTSVNPPTPGYNDQLLPAVFLWGTGPQALGQAARFGWAGDPTNAANGNFVDTHVDLAGVPGRLGTDVTRHYNSADTKSGVFGLGWSSIWDSGLTLWPDGTVQYRDDTGGLWHYTKSGANYVAPLGQTSKLVKNGDNTFTVTSLTGASWSFDTTGLLSGFGDGRGQTVSISRPGGTVLFTATNGSYTLTFKSGAVGVAEVDTPDSPGQTDHQIVAYTYGTEAGSTNVQTLKTVTRPYMTGETSPGTINYTTTGGRITQVSESMDTAAGKNRLIVANTFDPWGRVSVQTDVHGGVTTFKYGTGYNYAPATFALANYFGDPASTTVTNFQSAADANSPSCGCNPDVTVYYTDGTQSLVGVKDADTHNHQSVQLSNTYTNGQRQDTVKVSGATTRNVYDTQGRLQAIVKPDPNSTSGNGLGTLLPDGSNYKTAPGAIYQEFQYVSTTDNRIASHRDETGILTQYQYDAGNTTTNPNRVLTPCDPVSLPKSVAACPTGNVFTTSSSYFMTGVNTGLPQTKTDADGLITNYTYNNSSTHAEDNRKPETVKTYPTATVDDAHALITRYRYLHPGDAAFPAGAPTGTVRVDQVATPAGDFGTGTAEVTSSFYDGRGRLLRSDDPLSGTTDSNGVAHLSMFYTYYETGEPRTITDPAGNTLHTYIAYASDARHSYTDALEQWATPTDANVVEEHRSKDALNKVTEQQMDSYGDKLYDLKPNGAGTPAKTSYVYGKLGRLLSVTTPPINAGATAGTLTTYRYDSEGRVTDTVSGPDTTDTNKNHTITKSYDRWGRVIEEKGPAGELGAPTGSPATQTAIVPDTKYVYDYAGRPVAKLEGASAPNGDPAKLLTAFRYDASGRLWQTIVHRRAYYDLANPYTLATADSVTETRYTGARQAETWQPPADSFDSACNGGVGTNGYACYDWTAKTASHTAPDATVRITAYGYDKAGRQTTMTDPLGKTTSTSFDADSHQLTATSPMGYQTTDGYDKLGHVISVTTPSGFTTGSATVVVERTYDPRGFMVTDTDPHIPGQAAPQRRYHYDQNGRLDVSADQNATYGTNYQTFTSPHGWWQDPAANLTGYGYDDRGNRTTRTTKDDTGALAIEDWMFDPADHLIQQTQPHVTSPSSTQGSSYTYDNYGRLAAATATDGRSMTIGYWNPQTGGLQTADKTVTYKQTGQADLVYKGYVDARGQTTNLTEPNSTATVTTYDQEGRTAAVAVPSRTTNIAYSYDLGGNVHSVTYPDGHLAYVNHDADNRIISTCAMFGSSCWPHGTYGYNDDGLVTAEQLNLFGGNGSRSWTINAAHLATGFSEQITKPGTPTTYDTYQSTMTYGADSRLASETVTSNGTTGATTNYAYDNAGQLCMATTTASPTCATSTGIQYAYSYGTRGNRLTQKVGATTTYYAYNNSAQLCAQSNTAAPGCTPTTGNTTTYSYDNGGRRYLETTKTGTTVTNTITRTYDQRGVPTEIKTVASGTTTSDETRTYDAKRYLTGFTVVTGGNTWVYDMTWDRNRGVPQVLDSKYTLNGSSPAAWTLVDYGLETLGVGAPGASLSWYKYDAHGSPIASPSNTNAAAAPNSYDPFGVPNTSVTFPMQVSYKGEMAMGTTLFLRARDYDTATGTFTSRDSLDGVSGTTTAADAYTYGLNDPFSLSDPTGKRPQDSFENGFQKFLGTLSINSLQDLQNAVGGLLTGIWDGVFDLGAGLVQLAALSACITGGPAVAASKAVSLFTHNDFCSEKLDAFQQFAASAVSNPLGFLKTFGKGIVSWDYCAQNGAYKCIGHFVPMIVLCIVTDCISQLGDLAAGGIDALKGLLGQASDFDGAAAIEQAASACSVGSSFDPSTPVLMADGSLRPIRDVKVGDKVRTSDPMTGKVSNRSVAATMNHDDNDLIDLTVRGSSGSEGTIKTTDHHRIWSPSRHAWLAASDLTIDDTMRGADGSDARLVKSSKLVGHRSMLDLTVSVDHDFFVASAAGTVLVHNAGCAWDLADDKVRGIEIENQLAKSDYQDWAHMGVNDKFWPDFDFIKDDSVVSLKTTRTSSSIWDLRRNIDNLSVDDITNGSVKITTKIVDIRVPPGGVDGLSSLIQYGRARNVLVKISEYAG